MATNKTKIQAQINTIADGVLNPASTVRNVFGTDSDSILEGVYGSGVNELTSGTLTITTAGNFDYVLNFQKVGRFISISGVFNPTAVVSNGDVIATITDSDWIAQSNTFNGTAYGQGGEAIRIYINGNQIKVGADLLNAELFAINTLIYNSLN
jgi:hypothetical protein